MNKIDLIFKNIEDSLKDNKERGYFLTHSTRYKFIINRIKEISKGKRLKILDIGCFPYHVGKMLEDLEHEVYGISSYHEPIKKKNIKILNIEKEKLPFENNFFDLVLLNEVLEHLVDSPLILFNEIHRVTKKDGYFMLTTPNITRSINRVKLLFGKTIMYAIEQTNIYHRHNREFTLKELVFLFKKIGWKIEKAKYFISYTPFRKRINADPFLLFLIKFFNYILMIILPFLKDTLFILAKK